MKNCLLLFACAAFAQTPSFEVVSIKPAPPPDGTGMSVSSGGGPGSRDPSRWRCRNMTLANIVSNAFDLRVNELNAPAWMEGARFDIDAKVPEGATKEQLQPMMQNMLRERFGLQYHREKKDVQGYELVVTKAGPKFKESAPEPPKPGEWRGGTLGPDGFPVIPPGVSGMTIMRGRARSQWIGTTMDGLARNLAYQAERPVTNATGLTGKYDVSLFWVAGSMSAAADASTSDPLGPSLFTAIQEQLGLKLEGKKVTIEVLVVDHAEKVPTEN